MQWNGREWMTLLEEEGQEVLLWDLGIRGGECGPYNFL